MNRYRIHHFSIKEKRKNIASKIPTEILGEIFLHAIDEPISNIQDNSFPWAIVRVCKSWRSAFVNYPKLWTWITINIVELYSCGQDLKSVNRGLSLCLKRSRNNPLSISLHLPPEERGYDWPGGRWKTRPTFALIWKTFLSCSHRWRIVYLENVLEPQLFTLGSCTGATPILESLTIHNPKDDSDYSACNGFQIAPRLTRFTVLHPVAICAVRRWSVPWMQLINLTLRFDDVLGMDVLLYVLIKQLRDIEELRLILDGSEFDSSDLDYKLGTPQCLQHLRVLQVGCAETLGFITAPSLSELYLDDSDSFFHPQTWDDDPDEVLANDILSSFIQRSSCKIHKLTLSGFGWAKFTPLVQLFPDVVELCLADARKCLGHLLSPSQFPGLRVLDCTTYKSDVKYLMRTLLAILRLRNSSSATCSAAPLAKVIYRPMLKDGEASVLVTTTDWASFESYVQVGSCCELNLPRQLWLPEEAPQSPPPAAHSSPNTNIAPSASPSTETTFPWI
ncbi:hypothetical protein M378DRAFT_168886 [Amanita muscaria Koide BX008]|uniref:F-box domain-containing protein n=1 Tax=Amanita muscaria (strain Koide BX008) TaxID=946122 RepID=A0A0C2WED4_AMAMK|nr:hypothetical protein M378DRAFT_168886 [Amanita muscaria Koide BX008]